MDDDIREIATSIWETLFSVPLEPGTTAPAASDESTVTGCVHIDGAWHGAVMLTCNEDLAVRLAGELFQSESPSSDEIRDAIGEITNMLAGNIKAMLPEPSQISLPTVALGADYDLKVVGTRPVATVPFLSGNAPLVVTLLQSTVDDGQ